MHISTDSAKNKSGAECTLTDLFFRDRIKAEKRVQEGGIYMSGLQEQAVQMIGVLSDDNVKFLIDFMQRFMIPKSNRIQAGQTEETLNFMEEMETMRKRAQPYFSADFTSNKAWEEAMDAKYSRFD